MAQKSNDGTYVIVEKGDTLSEIAQEFLGAASKYQELASINGISDPNKIYVGQKIYLTKATASGSSSSKKSDSTKATITAFGLQSNTENTLFATWKWDKSNTENYEVEWDYDSGDGVWFTGTESSVTNKQSLYSYPSNAKRVRFKVKPVSKTYTNNNKETSYWKANWSTEKIYNVSSHPPLKPPTPDVEIDNFKLTATLDNLGEIYATQIQFQIVKDNSTVFNTGTANIKTDYVSYSCNVNAGSEYKVRCRAVKDKVYSEWSEYSNNEQSGPATPSGITTLKALSSTSVHVEWGAVKNAESYIVEYTTKKIYFDSSSEVRSTTIDAKLAHHTELTGLESGTEYFFRVRATRGNDQKSAWTAIKSIILGKKPIAPTTWSSTTTVIVGEDLTLYWVHNSQDGSKETSAMIELTIDGEEPPQTIGPIKNPYSDDEEDTTNHVGSHKIDTSKYSEGCKIEWRVQTAGITGVYGDWSIKRTVDVYAPPTLELDITDVNGNSVEVLESFPLYVKGTAGPNTQKPIGYYVSIISNDSYETVDNVGNPKFVNKGDSVYSKHFDITQDYSNDDELIEFLVELSAGNVNLENNMSYTLKCTVSMNSGLTSESSRDFSVSWGEMEFELNAEVSIDTNTISTSIRPYCEKYTTVYQEAVLKSDAYEVGDVIYEIDDINNIYTSTGEIVYMGSTGGGLYYCIVYVDNNGNPIEPEYRRVTYTNGNYITTSTILNPNYIEDVLTTTGETVFLGVDNRGIVIHYCNVERHELLESVKLSVYRREYDGSFTELATDIINTKETFITDPHPALDYARYRIVGILEETGAINYVDLPGIPIGEIAVVIQWDEKWSSFDVTNEDAMVEQPWSGSLLRLPYNVDVSDSYSSDVSLIEYVGRKRPVSYYGTQLGESSNWNVEIDKRDEETLYAIRRLALWMGDVYVREPSGSGYWATVKVSFSQTHCEVTIPVSFNITRVEGGM